MTKQLRIGMFDIETARIPPGSELTLADQNRRSKGFTLVEVIVAGLIMIILCVGVLSVFSFAVRINMGNNLRSQALTVLQKEIEYYRSLKYSPSQTDPDLSVGLHTRPNRFSEDQLEFTIAVEVDDDLSTAALDGSDATCTLKQIKITATPVNPRAGWLQDLKTNVTFQRVRAN